VSDLRAELRAVGIRGRTARRILVETAEHDVAALGDPRALAREFAEALGAAEARRAARVSFLALVGVGAAYVALFVSLTRAGQPQDIFGGGDPPLGFLAAVGLVLLPQVSFVGGVLALVARTPRLILRRAALGLTAGALALVCGIVFAVQFALHTPWLWVAAPGLALAVAAGAYALRAALIHTQAASRELTLTWPQALAVAALAAAAVGLAGASGGDVGEGLRNAFVESVAVMSGFATLGRAIGIRR
jgi:hypothetical protein